MSLVLFNVYISPLLRYLDEIGDEDIIRLTFVDEVTLAIVGDRKNKAIDKAEEAIGKMEEWAKSNGISFEKTKWSG